MSSSSSTGLDPLPWTPQPDTYSGIELPDGTFATFEPSTSCPCADCRQATKGARDGE